MVLHHIRVSIHPEDLLKVTEAPWVDFPVIWVVQHLKVVLRDLTVAHPMLELLVMVDHQEDPTAVPQVHMDSSDNLDIVLVNLVQATLALDTLANPALDTPANLDTKDQVVNLNMGHLHTMDPHPSTIQGLLGAVVLPPSKLQDCACVCIIILI